MLILQTLVLGPAYYRLTHDGKKQLAAQTCRWEQVVRAIGRILNPVVEKEG